MKPIPFLLNNRDSIVPDRTTSTLMLACHKKGHAIFATDVLHLNVNSSTALFADAYQHPSKDRVDSTAMLQARHLQNDGIRFAGLDLIGDKIVVVNVFSPNGLQELDRHLGYSVSEHVVSRWFEREPIQAKQKKATST